MREMASIQIALNEKRHLCYLVVVIIVTHNQPR